MVFKRWDKMMKSMVADKKWLNDISAKIDWNNIM